MTASPTETLAVIARWADYQPPGHLLADAERRRAATLPPWRRREWSAARLTARATLQMVFGRLPAGSAILSAADGAPMLTGSAAGTCTLSLAHCDGWAACACGPPGHALGIDIEQPGACDSALLARVSEPGQPPVPSQSSTIGWARKEAALKACRAAPPLLADYRLIGATRVASIRAGQVDRTLTTWSVELPAGPVLALAGDFSRLPRLGIFDAEDLLTVLTGPRQSLCTAPGRRKAG